MPRKKPANGKRAMSPIPSHIQVPVSEIQWPLNREILFRPDRYKYLKRKKIDDVCVFCRAHAEGLGFESLLVWTSAHSMVILNKFPYNNGHLLVLPQRHEANLGALSKPEFEDLHLTLKLTLRVLEEALEPQGVNIGMNVGRASGAGIPEHMHYHLVPRWIGDSNFFPIVAQTKVISQTMEETYKVIRPIFLKLSQ